MLRFFRHPDMPAAVFFFALTATILTHAGR